MGPVLMEISERTVKFRLRNLFTKLGLRERYSLIWILKIGRAATSQVRQSLILRPKRAGNPTRPTHPTWRHQVWERSTGDLLMATGQARLYNKADVVNGVCACHAKLN